MWCVIGDWLVSLEPRTQRVKPANRQPPTPKRQTVSEPNQNLLFPKQNLTFPEFLVHTFTAVHTSHFTQASTQGRRVQASPASSQVSHKVQRTAYSNTRNFFTRHRAPSPSCSTAGCCCWAEKTKEMTTLSADKFASLHGRLMTILSADASVSQEVLPHTAVYQ